MSLSDGSVRGVLKRHGKSPHNPPEGESSCLPPPSRPEDLCQSEVFWRQALKGFTAPTPLVVDRAASGLRETDVGSDERTIRLSTEIVAALLMLVQTNQVAVEALVHGAWGLLLSRYSGEEDVVFGAARDCRPPGIEGAPETAGSSSNTQPMRVRVNSDVALVPWIKQIHAQWMAMSPHAHVPMVKIQSWSEVPAGLPMFESVVGFDSSPRPTMPEAQRSTGSNPQPQLQEQLRCPLVLTVSGDTGLSLNIRFDCRRFDSKTIERMLGHLRTLLEAMAGRPAQRLGEMPLLTAAERHQLLVEWNRTEADYPDHKTLIDLFREQVQRTPDGEALVCGVGRLTYSELYARAAQVAGKLSALGVTTGSLVGICLERSPEMVSGILGTLLAGGAYVPLDPNYPKNRLSSILQDSNVKVLITQSKLFGSLPQTNSAVLCLDKLEDRAEGFQAEAFVARATDLAYVIYTSGSTGKPKGVALEHRNAVALVCWAKETFNPEELSGVLASTSISFDLSVFELFVPLSWGGKVILADNALALAALPAAAEVRLINTVPSAVRELLRLRAVPNTVQVINLAGEPLSTELVDQIYRETNVHKVFDLYGPTETTTYSTGALRKAGEPPTIGTPLANEQAYLLDPCLRPVPIGIPGEIFIGGAGLARCYLNRPELTAEKFIAHPFKNGARLYRTGDLARWRADGRLEFLGRIDHQVKIRGFRIELGEIEAVLMSEHAVGAAVVVAREDRPGDKRLAAYVVPRTGPPVTVEGLRRRIAEQLPDFMMPSRFVLLKALPMTPNGKIDRKALPAPEEGSGFSHCREIALEANDAAKIHQEIRNSASVFRREQTNYVAPRSDLERQLCFLWQELLGVEPVGVQDDFFELGGHSLLAVRLFAEIEKIVGRKFPPVTLFQAPTVARFAELIENAGEISKKPYVVFSRVPRDKPMLFCLHHLTAAQRLAGHLHSHWPVCGVQSPIATELRSWHENRRIEISLETLATRYLEIIKTVQTAGPYCLTGWCFGGVLAFEVARQLANQGEKIALLALLDATYEPGCKRLPMPRIRRLAHHVRRTATRGPTYFLRKLQKRFDVSNRRRSALQGMYANADFPAGLENLNLPQAEFQDQISNAYLAKPYPGSAVLVRSVAEPTSFELDSGATSGWESVVRGALHVEEIDCGHMDITEEPFIGQVAEHLLTYLSSSG